MSVQASSAGVAAGRDATVLNFSAPPVPVSRELSKKERIVINQKVEELADKKSMHPAEVWRDLHDCFCVESLDEVRENLLKAIHRVLDLETENVALQNDLSRLSEEEAKLRANAFDDGNEAKLIAQYRSCGKTAQKTLIANAGLFSKIPKGK